MHVHTHMQKLALNCVNMLSLRIQLKILNSTDTGSGHALAIGEELKVLCNWKIKTSQTYYLMLSKGIQIMGFLHTALSIVCIMSRNSSVKLHITQV